MKNVLMISAAFPPTGGPGVQRSVKFAKYLPDYGWHPTVWATEPPASMPRDETLLDDVPAGIEVHRHSFCRNDSAKRTWVNRLAPWISKCIVRPKDHPDELISWAQGSIAPLRSLIARCGIDAVYSTFSPASNHWLAMEIKRITGLPWVADFRDLWTDDYRYVAVDQVTSAADRALEQVILESADAVIGVSSRQTQILAAHLPEEKRKFHTITNGFDPDDFRAVQRQRAFDGSWVIAHVGRLDRWRACDAWFDGLREFVRTDRGAAERCVVQIMGHAGKSVRDQFRATRANCQFRPYGSHADAIQHMHDADVLILLVPDGPNSESVIPAKLFEYLAAGKPILVVGPVDGESAVLVRKLGAGQAVGFDAASVTAELRALYASHRENSCEFRVSDRQLSTYSRREQAGRLAAILTGITSESRAKSRSDTIEKRPGQRFAGQFADAT